MQLPPVRDKPKGLTMFLNTSNSLNGMRSARTTGALAIAGGAAFAALAALEVTHPHIHEVAVKTPAEHAILALFAAGMLLIAPAFFTLAQFGSDSHRPKPPRQGSSCSRSARRTRTSAAATQVGSTHSPESPTSSGWAARSGSPSTSTATATSTRQFPSCSDHLGNDDPRRTHRRRSDLSSLLDRRRHDRAWTDRTTRTAEALSAVA
jgi:hypothetical protein